MREARLHAILTKIITEQAGICVKLIGSYSIKKENRERQRENNDYRALLKLKKKVVRPTYILAFRSIFKNIENSAPTNYYIMC
mgnify:CR=1 FL=1